MFDLLFNSTFWYIALAVVAVVIIIWACIKFPSGKYFVGTFLTLGIVCFTFYAGIQLNSYYKASGGIYGYISGLFETNQVEVTDASFKFSNMELKQVDGGDTYMAKILTNDKVLFEKNKIYFLSINDNPSQTISYSIDYIQSKYSYSFYDNQRQLLISDSLYFNFAFHTNSTYIEIFTKGGSEAVKYWNYWFNKNAFIVTIEETNYQKDYTIIQNEMNLNSNQSLITYFVDTELVGFQVAEKGSKLEEMTFNTPENIQINGWQANNQTVDLSDYTVTGNVNFKADYTELVYLELRDGDINNYKVVDSGYYEKNQILFDCIGYNLPYSVMTNNLNYELYDGSMTFIDFGQEIEEIAGGVVYIADVSIWKYPEDFLSHRFDYNTKSFVLDDAQINDNVDLSFVKNVSLEHMDIIYTGDNRKITLNNASFVKSGNLYTYNGNKIWTTSDGGEVEENFELSYSIDANLNITITVSDNFITSQSFSDGSGGTLKTPYKFDLSALKIDFDANIFYLV